MTPIAPSDPDSYECFRLKALKELDLLDTASEAEFDRLTELAADVFGTPIALVSLVDERRQWFKSRRGLEAAETPRDVAFCSHAIRGDEVFVVEDATQDPRFADNPLVTGGPEIRFYAGAPLRTTSGYAIGTLCVIDTKPRPFSPGDAEQLRTMASLVVAEAEVRALKRRLGRERTARETVEQMIEEKSLELFEARRRAELSSRAKSEFLASMGHELRTPLNAILGFTDLLLREVPGRLTPQQQEYLVYVQESGERLRDVFEQILQMAAIELGRVELRPGSIHLQEFIGFLAGLVNDTARRRRVALKVQVAPDLPDVTADRGALLQALRAVLDNAIKFSPEGGLVTVDCRARDPEECTITVRDDGPGIPADQIARVCRPFEQLVGGLARATEGAGLGLPIAKSLVEAHGGSFAIDSDLGRGTTVRITVPVAGPLARRGAPLAG